uniref:Putative secreted protein n=1 Tax=Ixodes ricinus TaxID=34613 RepID=A0A6B0UB67_IXORI
MEARRDAGLRRQVWRGGPPPLGPLLVLLILFFVFCAAGIRVSTATLVAPRTVRACAHRCRGSPFVKQDVVVAANVVAAGPLLPGHEELLVV